MDLRPSLHRATLSDMVGLWESLQQQGEAKLLQAVEEKFTIEPFKAKSMKDVEDLGNLVQIQRWGEWGWEVVQAMQVEAYRT